MYLFGGTQTPFYRLKKAANILQNYSVTQLDAENAFQRIEKRNLDEMLERFWRIMAPFEDEDVNVQIIEKNTEQL